MLRFIFTFFSFLFLTTCATTSNSVQMPIKPPDPLADLDSMGEFAPLESGAEAYVFIDASRSQPILELFALGNMTPQQFGQIAERTSAVRAALYKKTVEGQKDNFMAVAQGDYPNVLSAMALTANSDWQKVRAWNGAPYWYSETAGLAMTMNAKWMLFSTREPFAHEPASLPPAGFDGFRQSAIIAGWLEDQSALNKTLEVMEIPIEINAKTVFFRVDSLQSSTDPDKTAYKMILRLELSDPEQSAALMMLFELARLFIGENSAPDTPQSLAAKAFLANPLDADKGVLTLTSDDLSAERLAMIFDIFSACL
ncbi:MAG: hypothetical protein LBG05_08895 [Treponema sp.]|jgi:hypothetical protein|nr:hypothetical protein [Treponema sp.]